MAQIAKGVGMVAGLVAAVTRFIPALQPISAIATVISVAASIAGAAFAQKPTAQGSTSGITIGATMPNPLAIGDFYYGGSRVAQVGYGDTDHDVKNPYLWVVDVYSVAGPIAAISHYYTDFTEVTFSGSGKAIGYYSNDTLFMDSQLGATPEGSALTPHFGGATDWGADYKLSGKTAVGWNARRPKDGKRYAQGFPQTGIRGLGVLDYDPRHDSSYPGGSGTQRWADPADAAAFSAAKASFAYAGGNVGVVALNYALGKWERDESKPGDPYRRVAGVGGGIDQIVVEDFVELANVCDANGWTVNGIVSDGQGISKWENLKRILQAGGAAPAFKGARLGLDIRAPRIALDTITMADIGEGEPEQAGTYTVRDRKNILIPKYTSPDHKWTVVATKQPVKVLDWIAEDGEEREQEWPLELVTNPDQAAQLTGYELADRREQGPIGLPVLPRLRGYGPGAVLAVDDAVAEYYGIQQPQVRIRNRTRDLGQMMWTLGFVTETAGKHDFALALTGSSPPVPTIVTPEDRDGAAVGAEPAAPDADDWTVAGTTVSSADGSIPALLVTRVGAVDTGGLLGIQFEYRTAQSSAIREDGGWMLREDGGRIVLEDSAAGDWQGATLESTGTLSKPISAVAPGQLYEVSVRYVNAVGPGDRLVLGPVTAGALSGGDARASYRLRWQSETYPITSDDHSITIEAFDAVMDNGDQVSLPAGSITGLSPATTYGVFWHLADQVYSAVAEPAADEIASPAYLFVLWQDTSDAGVFDPDPTAPGGYGGQGPVKLSGV